MRKSIEIRRHAESHKPGDNLSARGILRAGNTSARRCLFDLVVTSPLPRAVQTAVAMGHGVDEEDWTMASMGRSLTAFPWDKGFAAMQRAIRTDPVASACATHQTAQLRHWIGRVAPGESVLVVAHGSIAAIGIIGLLGDADVSGFGPSLGYCEGVRLELEGERVVSVQLLRFDGDEERAASPALQ